MKYLLFDLDGTLTDPYEGITKSILYALQACGIETAEPDTLRKCIGPPILYSFRTIFGLDEEKAEFAVKKYRERYGTVGLFENDLLPGVTELLQTLQAHGCVMGVASSKPKPYVDRILEKFDILRYFAVTVGSGLDGSLATKTLVIEEALRQMGVKASDPEVVMIGDRKYDIFGAKECGLKSVGIKLGYAEEGELESAGADKVVGSFSELAEVLLKKL